MKKRRIMAFILALAALVCMLSGCAGSETTTAEPETETSAAAESQTPETTEPSAEPESEFEAEAAPVDPEEMATAEEIAAEAEVVIEYPLSDGSATLTYWLPWIPLLSSYYSGYEEHPGLAYAEELTGVKIEYISCSQEAAQTEFNLMVASESTTDILSGASQYYTNGTDAGVDDEVFIDLSEHLADWSPAYLATLKSNDQWMKYVTTDNGNIAAYVGFDMVNLGLSQGNFVRQDWLDELGLDVPVTYDDYYNVLTAFKTNYDVSDPYLMSGNLTSTLSYVFGVPAFNIESTTSLCYFMKDGEVTCALTEPGFKDYIAMLNQWYSEGLISSDFYTRSSNAQANETTSLIYDDQVGIWNTVMSNFEDYPKKANNPNFANTPIGDALPSEGQKLTYKSIDVTAGSNASISCTCEDVELAMKWLDFWYSDDGGMIARYGVPGVSYELDENGEPYYLEAITNNPDGMVYQLARIFYCPNGVPALGDPRIVRDHVYSEGVLNCSNVWNEAYGSSESVISSQVSMTVSESEEFYSIYTDIGTYAAENLIKFVIGDLSMDEFDSFVAQIESMNLARCNEIYAGAVERYNSR